MMTPQPGLLIRKASVSDTSLLAELGARTFSSAFAADNTTEDMADYLATNFTHERVAQELCDADSTFFIAEVEGESVGYAKVRGDEAPSCVTDNKTIELVRLYILPAYFGRGVGEALMRACMDEARQAGFQTIWLGVWENNHRAQAFYRKFGFQIVGEHIFQLGSDAQIDKIMECAL
jgi:ribosomal protein S18 acetylase RimI-like enzyme